MKPRSETFYVSRPTDTNALQLFEPTPNAAYGLSALSAMLQVPRRTILLYCKNGFISPVTDAVREGYFFDEDAVVTIRKIESIRQIMRDELAAVGMVLELLHELERLRTLRNFVARATEFRKVRFV